MKKSITDNIIENIIGYNRYAQAWKDWHMLRGRGIPGLSGEEEERAINSLRPDNKHGNELPI